VAKLKDLLPKPHPTKTIFKTHNFPIAAVAKYLGFTYTYTVMLLNGNYRITPENEVKLHELAGMVSKEMGQPAD